MIELEPGAVRASDIEQAVAEAMRDLGFVARPVVVKVGERYVTRGWAWQKEQAPLIAWSSGNGNWGTVSDG